jgi:hypothetical protein
VSGPDLITPAGFTIINSSRPAFTSAALQAACAYDRPAPESDAAAEHDDLE